jgi:SAM-dependent methyltransferase
MKIKRLRHLLWQEGPRFDYSGGGKKPLTVNVVGSGWLIRGALAHPVCGVIEEFKQSSGGSRVLDFGAGAWLRYTQYMRKRLPTYELHAVEFDDAFQYATPAALKNGLVNQVKFWQPKSFERKRGEKFDLILLINVLNTMPEEEHQEEVFKCLSERLNPTGWLVVYQRTWVASENPPDALPYKNGWLIPQRPPYDYYTYRSGNGANWFNSLAKECGLNPVPTRAARSFTSNNTVFKVWEKLLE